MIWKYGGVSGKKLAITAAQTKVQTITVHLYMA